jgi:hypothetical protein
MATSAAAAPGTGAVASSGITVLTEPEAVVGQLSDAQADSLDAAQRTAEADPDNLSWPYIDRATGTLVVTATTPTGLATAKDLAAGYVSARALAARAALAAAKPGAPALPALTVRVPARTVMVKHSARTLQTILDQVIGVDAVTPGVTVWDDYRDPENNRVVLETNAIPDDFLKTLATRYDRSAIAVRVVARNSQNTLTSRGYDGTPFYGGADYTNNSYGNHCTSGFEWTDGSTRYMISAGHCAKGTGGSVSTPWGRMGDFGGWTWQPGVGSVSWYGSCSCGDLSFVTIDPSLSNAAYIYTGGPNSYSRAPVTNMWNRRPENGDQYCTGGAVTGEQCGWVTDHVADNITYDDGSVCRHCSWSYRACCLADIAGDSGGPVYTIDGLGNIAAKGLMSGRSINTFGTINIYSDIWDAYYAFPGWLLTG